MSPWWQFWFFFLCFLKNPLAIWLHKVFVTCSSPRLHFPKRWLFHTWKTSTQNSLTSMGEGCQQWRGHILSLSLVRLIVTCLCSEMVNTSPDITLRCFRHIHPEKQEGVHWQQSQTELGQHQHGAAGCSEDNGGKYWGSSAKGRSPF